LPDGAHHLIRDILARGTPRVTVTDDLHPVLVLKDGELAAIDNDLVFRGPEKLW
jgi:hypothetical protein